MEANTRDNRVVPERAGTGPEPSEAERHEVVDWIQQALAEDLIGFDELDDRFIAVYAATSRAELERVTADLPVPAFQPPAPTARHGDKKQDLSPRVEGGPLIRIAGFQAIGDVKVHSLSLVPDGALRRLWSKLRPSS